MAPLESAPARITVAADELGADGVGFADGVDRVVENVADEVPKNLKFGGLSEEKEDNSKKIQNFSEKNKKFQNTNKFVANSEKVGEV